MPPTSLLSNQPRNTPPSTARSASLKAFYGGAATAAYQVEGAWNVDGRGESVWDRFSQSLGNTKGGWTGDIACDEYHRYPEDIAFMKQMNLRSYHSWSILDNFEWSEGYTQRFGMVFVDFPTQRRFIKDSAKWYSQLAASNILDDGQAQG